MKIITAAAVKGGSGKTYTVLALSQAAVKDGKRVLVVDLDPQSNATMRAGADPLAPETSYSLLHGKPAAGAIQSTKQGFDIIPGAPNLLLEATRRGSSQRLRTALEPIKKNYDLIMIDTPPTQVEMIYNALQAADWLLIPIEAEASNIQGMYQIAGLLAETRESGHDLTAPGIVVTRYDSRPNINRFMLERVTEAAEHIGIPVLQVIRQAAAIREAMEQGRSLFDHAPNSKPAADYLELYNKLKGGI